MQQLQCKVHIKDERNDLVTRVKKEPSDLQMPSIKDEPTEGEPPLNGLLHPSLPLTESTNQSTVKCEWSLKGTCACADGKCEDCQASEKEDEKEDILTPTLAAIWPLNNHENDETEFHPPIWEDCEETENTDTASEAAKEVVTQVLEPIDVEIKEETGSASDAANEVNTAVIEEEINYNVEEGNANKETEMQVEEASQGTVPVASSPGALGRSTQARKGPINVQQVNIEQGNTAEIKEERPENLEEEIKKKDTEIREETSQGTAHVVAFPVATGNESPVFEAIDENRKEKRSLIEAVNTEDDFPLSHRNGNVNTEPESDDEEEAGQVEATALSSLSLRRSSRIKKRPVNYAILPEAEEETHQDDPSTDTSESDSEESETETEIDSEMEVDEPSEAEESYPIAANGDGRPLSRRSFPCRHCKKRFASKQSAHRHEEIIHSQIVRSRPYVCSHPDCGRAFLFQSHLDEHSISHSGLRPFTCSTCGTSFNRKNTLKSHQQTHTVVRRAYACVVCLKAFKWKKSLVYHSLLHSGLKSFTCADCGDSFTTKVTLEKHRQLQIDCAGRYTPSESRPFSCTVEGCGKAFKKRSYLGKHLQTHSGLRTFKCTVCEGAFTCKGSLKRHRRKCHIA